MPKVIQATLRPFVFHGVILGEESNGQVVGDCPLCGREGKFSIESATGKWRCFVCLASGNDITFLRQLWEASEKATTDYSSLSSNRHLVYSETLMYWGVCKSVVTGDWLVPGYNAEGKQVQLYRYLKIKGEMKLLPTPEAGGHGIHGANLYNKSRPDVYLCEGPWDGIVLWETMRGAKWSSDGKGLETTASEASSLVATSNVLAIPGCGSVGTPLEKWLPLFAGKNVCLMFDNDHPSEVNGTRIEPAGYAAMRRASEIMARASEPPLTISMLRWKKGADHEPSLLKGYDLRDALSGGGTIAERLPILLGLLSKVEPIPAEWIPGRSRTAANVGGTEIDCLPCTDYRVLVNSWRKAMKWIPGLDHTLPVMLACVLSTESVGDQLWLRVISPPSSGKSVLCEALSVNRKYVFPKDTMTGLFSGFQVDKEGSEDMSLVARLKNKTLVVKDGDTLLQAPNRSQILSQLRATYDRAVRTNYGNRMSQNYEGLNITVILCGTSGLRELDTSELGERCLTVTIVEDMDEDLEDEIALRVAYRAERELSIKADGKLETRDGPELIEAKRLTGGYVGYLRDNAQELIEQVSSSDEVMRRCTRLGKFTAYMRARPSSKQDEKVERELSFRLVSQIVRLAKCLAVVLNKTSIDAEVMDRVTKVSLDTCRGKTLNLVGYLREAGEIGVGVSGLAAEMNETDEATGKLVRFLRKIGATETYTHKLAGVISKTKWRLTARLVKLYDEIIGDAHV